MSESKTQNMPNEFIRPYEKNESLLERMSHSSVLADTPFCCVVCFYVDFLSFLFGFRYKYLDVTVLMFRISSFRMIVSG